MSRAIRGGLSLGLNAAAMALHFAVVGDALVRVAMRIAGGVGGFWRRASWPAG